MDIETRFQKIEETLAKLTNLVQRATTTTNPLTEPNPAVASLIDADNTVDDRPSIFDVIRYVRKQDDSLGCVDNRGGATLLFNLDYEAEEVSVWAAICSDHDNFNKSIGRELVQRRKDTEAPLIAFDISDVDQYNGLVYALSQEISVLMQNNVLPEDRPARDALMKIWRLATQ